MAREKRGKQIEVRTPENGESHATERVRERETDVEYEDRPSIADFLKRIVYFLLGIVEAILGLRVLLTLLGADPTNAFASFIYTISRPLAQPFFTLFNYNLVDSQTPHIELGTITAMVVYALLAALLSGLISLARRR
jgi:hypothetical protein